MSVEPQSTPDSAQLLRLRLWVRLLRSVRPVEVELRHRLARCQPWGGCGYDPVPPRRAGGSQNQVRRCV